MSSITIAGRPINKSNEPFIIAEISGNHNGSINNALKLIELAKQAGADAVKLQTYTPDTMTIPSSRADFMIKEGLWAGKNLHELYQWAYTPWEWHKALYQRAKELGMIIFSTPFDETSVDFLESLDSPAYKIASFEITDHELIKKIASTKKPIILSTGMANLAEIKDAVNIIQHTGENELAILHCISGYPTPLEEANLNTITDLAIQFPHVIGLSDHTRTTLTSIIAVSLGACIIEKHIKLNDIDEGPDTAFSLTPSEFEILCRETKSAWKALGTAGYELKPSEVQNLTFRRSLYAVEPIKKGESFTSTNVRCIRPGFGLAPQFITSLIGQRAACDIDYGTPLDWSMVNEPANGNSF